MLRNLPNALTVCNMLFGFWGILFCLAFDDAFAAVWMMSLAAVFDVADGALARVLNVSSPLGKDLDSLADAISFGVLPGMLIYKGFQVTGATLGIETGTSMPMYVWIAVVSAVPAMAMVRLARFNNDPGQAKYFRGLPTPAAALSLVSIFMALPPASTAGQHSFQYLAGFSSLTLAAIGAILAVLMVSPLKLLSLKLPVRSAWPYWLGAIAISAGLLPWAQGYISFVFIMIYVVVSQAYFILNKKD